MTTPTHDHWIDDDGVEWCNATAEHDGEVQE